MGSPEEKSRGEFIGFIGLGTPSFEAPFTPCTEIGWRLKRSAWGKGLASEGARAVLAYAFGKLNLKEVVSFTSQLNLRSIRVMETIGMTRDLKGDFKHPKLESTHRLCNHVLYRMKNPESENV